MIKAQHGQHVILEKFLQHPKVDTTIRGNFPLKKAMAHGHKDVVKMLVEELRVCWTLSLADLVLYVDEAYVRNQP